jgi:lysozyme family protein
MSSSSFFEKIWPFVFAHEGGYCDDPGDPGGPTKFGVSLRWLNGQGMDVNNDGRIDASDIKALVPDDAKKLFKAYFWDYLNLELFPGKTGMVMFDTAVNTGCSQSVKFLQRSLNSLDFPELSVDGIIGKRTLTTVREVKGRDSDLALRILSERRGFYRDLAAKPPTPKANYRKFLNGWLNRVDDLEKLLEKT